MADITVPVLESFSRISGTGLQAGQQVTMQYDVYDQSPISTVIFTFRGPTNNTYQVRADTYSGPSLNSGQISTPIQEHWPDGYYTLENVWVYERSGERNGAIYYRGSTPDSGYISKDPSGAKGPTSHDFNFSEADFIVGNVTAAHNQITGTDGNDKLAGPLYSYSHDQLNGGSGNDILSGDWGNDILDGGAGTDTAVWLSPRFANKISLIQNGDDTVSGPEWTDKIRGVEHFVFTDGEFVTDTSDVAAQVYRLYGATLDRAPDQSGLKGWLGGLESGTLTLQQAAGGFTSSPEFQIKYDSLDNAGFVDLLYDNVLGRNPDPGGFQNWLNDMANGMSRSEVVLAFSESPENVELTRAAVERGIWVRDDQAAMIARLYDTTLDRLPDSPGLSGWVGAIKGGMTPQQAANGFTGSPEFQQKYGSLDDTVFVQQLYRNVLDREGEASGVEAWKGGLQGGITRADVVLGFSEAPEHQNKLAAYIDDGIWLL